MLIETARTQHTRAHVGSARARWAEGSSRLRRRSTVMTAKQFGTKVALLRLTFPCIQGC